MSISPAKVQTNGKSQKEIDEKALLEQNKLVQLTSNFSQYQLALDWLNATIDRRIEEVAKENESEILAFQEIMDKPVWAEGTAWHDIEDEMRLTPDEMFMLIFVYVSQFSPSKLSRLWDKEKLSNNLGGIKKDNANFTYPTFRTIVYLLGGEKEIKRAYYYPLLVKSRLFKELVVVSIDDRVDIFDDQRLRLNEEYYHWLMTGKRTEIGVSSDFPAVILKTHLSFSDLVLKPSVTEQLEFLMDFVRDQKDLYADENFAYKVKKGYVAMLYGPPGTGKTLTVSVMGKELGIDVYCIDLSRVVSKYIGETEKNLEKIFERLENKRCILFFDEADALFGKRTEVKDSKDRYANQEVAYLLQKIERFPGLVILTSNYNQNLDSAFRRRILSSIFMPPPSEPERNILWRKALPSNFSYESDEMVGVLSEEYMLTGANISNIIKLACIKSRKEKVVTMATIVPIIKLEQHKEKSQG